MKSLNAAVIVSSLALLFSGVAQAKDSSHSNAYQNTSKRPYQHVLQHDSQTRASQWEGATLQTNQNDDQSDIQKANSIRQINLNMISKRSFM